MKAKDVMIPISDCAQVAEDHSLQAAIIMLSAYRQRLSKTSYPPRFVLVHNAQYKVVGVLRHLEILKALAKASGPGGISFPKMIAAAPRVAAGDAMTLYSEAEHIDANASAEDAVAKMLAGSFRHLIVEENGEQIGIIRLSEIFAQIRKDIGKAAQD
jgi:CBS domain-containing protein